MVLYLVALSAHVPGGGGVALVPLGGGVEPLGDADGVLLVLPGGVVDIPAGVLLEGVALYVPPLGG